jgi:hypothetical protein
VSSIASTVLTIKNIGGNIKVIVPRSARFLFFAVVLLMSPMPAMATEHLLVANEQGVWLGSDSLALHNDGKETTQSQHCKVVISRGRLIFNMGYFKDLALLEAQETKLPFASLDVTMNSILDFMKTNQSDVSNAPWYSKNNVYVNSGIVQAQNTIFSAIKFGQGQGAELRTVGDGHPNKIRNPTRHIS